MEFKGNNIFKPFNGKSRTITNAISNVLGDKYRSQIEQKLGDTKIVCAGNYVEDITLNLPMKQMQYVVDAGIYAEEFKNKYHKSITESDLSENEKQDELYIKYTKAKYESDEIQNLINQDKIAKQKHMQTIDKVSKLTDAAKDKYVQMAELGDKHISIDSVSDIDVEYLVDYVKMGKEEFLKYLETNEIAKEDLQSFCEDLGVDKGTFINNLFTEDFISVVNETGDVDITKKYYDNHVVQQVIDEMISEDIYISANLEQDIIKLVTRKVAESYGFATIAKTNDGSNKGLCMLPTGLSCQTNVVSHELLHVVDEFIVQKGKLRLCKSGFTVQINDANEKMHCFVNITDNGDSVKINYESGVENSYDAFNEIFNEYLTRIVVKKLSENGEKIGSGKFEVGDSAYDEGVDMFSELFDEFFEEFVTCKMKPNLHSSINKHVGFANFNRLANLAQRVLDKEKVSENEKQQIFGEARKVMRELNNKNDFSM